MALDEGLLCAIARNGALEARLRRRDMHDIPIGVRNTGKLFFFSNLNLGFLSD